jgi:predicted dehydrogenase
MNQCPHQFDIFQWICGMPSKVRGFCQFGRSHNVEVEDEVTAWFEFPNGAQGVFVSSTGEAPGVDRLEIAGDSGLLTIEGGALRLRQNQVPAPEFIRTSKKGLDKPPCRDIPVETAARPDQAVLRRGVLENFAEALKDESVSLVCEGKEGLNSTMLSNSILLSSLQEKTVTLPLDASVMTECMRGLIASSKEKKTATA